jgi:hypothetical protein
MRHWSFDPAIPPWSRRPPTEIPDSQGRETEPSHVAQARIQRLLSGSQAALRHALALRQMQALHRIALHRSHYNPNQPRVPAGNPDGGQWTAKTTASGGNDPRIISDVTFDDDWKPGARYATNSGGRGPIRIRIRGQWVEAEPGQAARLAAAEARAQDAIRRVREVDPSWRPKPSAYGTGIESEIRKANDVASEAQARIAELQRVGIGPGRFAAEWIPARGSNRTLRVDEREISIVSDRKRDATPVAREIRERCPAIS